MSAEHPDAGRVDDAGRFSSRGAPAGRSHQRVDRLPIDFLAARRVLERGVHDRVTRLGGRCVRGGFRQLADNRRDAAARQTFRLFRIAHERRHLVSAAQQRVEHSRPDYPVAPVRKIRIRS